MPTHKHRPDPHLDLDRYRIPPGTRVDLADRATREDGGLDKRAARRTLKPITKRLQDLQELLYASGKRSLLIVFQAMDAGGKDSTTRHVLGPLDPTGVRVTSFKAPTPLELRHDFLWRIHRACPPRGYISVFNRSHYEDIVAVRVKRLAPESVWRPRYDHINDFERLLTQESTVVLKFFLHISKEYQKERLQRRLDRADKLWKFDPDDLDDRARWNEFQAAWSEVFTRCNTADSPWFLVPAEFRPWRDLVVATAVQEALERLNLTYPEPDFDPAEIRVK